MEEKAAGGNNTCAPRNDNLYKALRPFSIVIASPKGAAIRPRRMDCFVATRLAMTSKEAHNDDLY